MATQTPQQAGSGSKSSRPISSSPNTPLSRTLQQPRHQWVHKDAANAAIENITHDAHSQINFIPQSSKKNKQHAIGCELMDIKVEGHQAAI